MQCFRKILNIPYIERTINEEVLDRIKEKQQLWQCIQSKRDKMTGQQDTYQRHENVLKTIEGDVEGRGNPI